MNTINLLEEDYDELYKVISGYKENRESLENFVKGLLELLTSYRKKLLIEELKMLQGGRLGLIFWGYSKLYNKNLVLKIIPEFLSVFEIESTAYKHLSESYMCKIFEINDIQNVIVMEKLDNEKTLKYSENKEAVLDFFDKVYSNLIEFQNLNSPLYIEVFKTYFEQLNEMNVNDYDFLKEKALELYEEKFKDKQLYLLHCDLHSKNIMKGEDDYYAIDPLGYVAPKEFAFVRFIITELFFISNTKEYLGKLLEFISRYSNYDKLLYAAYIDSIFFLSGLLLQIKDYHKHLPRVLSIIDLLEEEINKRKEVYNEKSCNNISKTRKLVFGS